MHKQKRLLPGNVTTKSAYTGTKLSSKFVSTNVWAFKKHQLRIIAQRIILVRQDNFWVA